MLEIIILFKLGSNIANKAKRKGLSGTAFVFLLLALWFGGEIGGGILGALVSAILNPREEPHFGLIYVGSLICAILGAVIAFKVVDFQKQPAELWAPPPMDAEAGMPPGAAPALAPDAEERIQERRP